MKNNRILTIVICISVAICFSTGFSDLGRILQAEAEENETYFTAEEYTDGDKLLKKDGTISDKNIQTFALEVQNGNDGDYFPELAEVIPRQYLESDADNATFAYNGKEYGYRE